MREPRPILAIRGPSPDQIGQLLGIDLAQGSGALEIVIAGAIVAAVVGTVVLHRRATKSREKMRDVFVTQMPTSAKLSRKLRHWNDGVLDRVGLYSDAIKIDRESLAALTAGLRG